MNVQHLAMVFCLPVLCACALLAFYRLARGPTLPDRVIALDLMGMIGIGIMTATAIAGGSPILLDVALVLALILFLGTVGFAVYVARRAGL